MNKKILRKNYRKNIVVVGMITSFGVSLHAQESATEFVEPSVYETLWGYATLYKDDLNPYIQEFKLRGRYHGQYYDVDADNGQADHWEDRRSRFGFDAKLFDKKLEARVDFQSNDGFEDIYDGLVDARLKAGDVAGALRYAETAEVQERHRAIAEWKPKLDSMREDILLKAATRGE